ncbi:MAG: hypothetical protein IKV00_00420 [Clostridia bacterium]|nr:hypothetical protein [Clostridia bacterium]
MSTQPEINQSTSAGVRRSVWMMTVAVTLLLIVSIVATALVTFRFTVKTFFPEPQERYADIEILGDVLNDSAYYVADQDAMNVAAVKAYIEASGDEHAYYFTDDEYAAYRAEKAGRYVGIGVVVREAEVIYNAKIIRVIEIVRVAKNSPSAECGLLSAGDYIYGVETADGDVLVDDVGVEATTALIRGDADTAVSLIVLSKTNGGYEEKRVTLERKAYESCSVEFFVSTVATEAPVGVVRIYKFDLTTPTQLSAAIDQLVANGVSKFVFDLRDNGGGDLSSVIACTSYFLKPGDVIFSTERKNGETEENRAVVRTYTDEYEPCSVSEYDIGKYAEYEYSVLVNENTASAAEIFTAVFKDYGLAKIVGVTTYGKGSVQTYISLSPYGMQGVLKITTSHYYPPCGEGYHGVGIEPDIFIELLDGVNMYTATEAEDNQLVCAISMVVVPFEGVTVDAEN